MHDLSSVNAEYNEQGCFFFSKSKLTVNLFGIRTLHLTVTDIFIILSDVIPVLKTFVKSKVLKRDIREIPNDVDFKHY